jgi:ubiquinone/menaquinone biosynthesis C-methylase UbiE
MTTSVQWQLAREAAERYQTILTPAILGPFARALVDFAALEHGEQVVDIGCGTGAAARYAAELAGFSGMVIGVDKNASMIEVANGLPSVQGAAIEWREADVVQLPLADEQMDVILCAQTLQFLPDKQAGLSEMWRVLRTDGRIVLSLWCSTSDNPYFEALIAAIDKHIGPETAVGLQSAFSLTDGYAAFELLREAGFRHIDVSMTQLALPFPNLSEFVPRHISATPMVAGFERASVSVQQEVIRDVITAMSRYGVNGRYQIPFKSHLIMARK